MYSKYKELSSQSLDWELYEICRKRFHENEDYFFLFFFDAKICRLTSKFKIKLYCLSGTAIDRIFQVCRITCAPDYSIGCITAHLNKPNELTLETVLARTLTLCVCMDSFAPDFFIPCCDEQRVYVTHTCLTGLVSTSVSDDSCKFVCWFHCQIVSCAW